MNIDPKDRYRTDKPLSAYVYEEFPRNAPSECALTPLQEYGPTDRADDPVISADSISSLSNLVLAKLSRNQYELLGPHLVVSAFTQNTVLLEAGENFEHVYFPHDGMLSLLAVMRDGKAIETATVGREGFVGGMAGLGVYRSLVRVTVQLPTTLSRISVAQFRKLVSASPELRDACIQFNETLLTQARVTAACNALHPVEARFCRWLLQSADRAGGPTVRLTQELLAEMLGVRRTSVTEVAGKMQSEGIITYSRGVITILDRGRLERLSCECYQTLVERAGTPDVDRLP